MKPFTVLNGGCVLMPYENIDTDQLIPARFMNRTRASGYGGYLFYDLRYNASGGQIPEFELNKTNGSELILVSGHNFGCGSSAGGGGLRATGLWVSGHCGTKLWRYIL